MPSTSTEIRTFEIVQYVSGFMEGELKDWPASVQDAVAAALEKKAHEVELTLVVVGARCDRDYEKADDDPFKYFIEIIASEVVVADSREVDPIQRLLH